MCVHEQTFRLTRIMRDKLLSQAHSLVTQRGNVRCRVPTSLIPPLFGAWPPGSVEMVPTSVPPAATDVSLGPPKSTSTAFEKYIHVRQRSLKCVNFNVRQGKPAYRCASAPQGRQRHISPVNTCIHRDPSGSMSFGPRRNDRAEWTTTRHIDLTSRLRCSSLL